jgi:hypothetical protein
MFIFVDESGSFVGPKSKSALSAVGALIVPERRMKRLEDQYARLRPKLPQEKGEVKGRLLDEEQLAAVIKMVAKIDVLFECSVVDTNAEPTETIAPHKMEQAKRITADLTDQHHPNVRHAVLKLRKRLEVMLISFIFKLF